MQKTPPLLPATALHHMMPLGEEINFDSAEGYAIINEMIEIELYRVSEDGVLVAGRLRCSPDAAIELRLQIDSALKAAVGTRIITIGDDG